VLVLGLVAVALGTLAGIVFLAAMLALSGAPVLVPLLMGPFLISQVVMLGMGRKRVGLPTVSACTAASSNLPAILEIGGRYLFTDNLLFVYVEPNEFGIKVKRMGMNRGVQKKVYTAGLNLVIPYLWEMHRLPRDIQVLELADFPQTAADLSRKDRSGRAIDATVMVAGECGITGVITPDGGEVICSVERSA
jgi:hypothetical protein